MHWKLDLDARSLTNVFDDTMVKSAKLCFPDKYPVSLDFVRGSDPFLFTGVARTTIKPVNGAGSAALAVLEMGSTGAETVEGVLNLGTAAADCFVPSFGTRPAVLEVLVVDEAGVEVASWAVNCELSRRYSASGDIAEDLPGMRATQAEAEEGADNTKWMTPLRVRQMLESLGLLSAGN